MLPDRVSNPGPLTYKPGALPIALRDPAKFHEVLVIGYLARANFMNFKSIQGLYKSMHY